MALRAAIVRLPPENGDRRDNRWESVVGPKPPFDDNGSAAVPALLAKPRAILFDNRLVVDGVERFS